MTQSSAPLTAVSGDPLSPERAAQVLKLVEAATSADGVRPLSEDALLQLRHRPHPLARDLVLITPGQVVIGYAHLNAPGGDASSPDDDDLTGDLVVHPDYRRQGHGATLLAALRQAAAGQAVRLWAHGDSPAAARLARSEGLTRVRELLQLRMPLAQVPAGDPTWPAGITIRTFVPGQDEAAWLEVNRRAFAHHPEQGSWTPEDLRLREAEPWFDPAGFFLAERDGRLAGFHWTKVHPAGDADGGPIGEVYVVGVDPGQQGGGLGRGLTLTGLAHLRAVGLANVLLYVDDENTAAVKMYTSLGFGRWATDVMYRGRAVPQEPRS